MYQLLEDWILDYKGASQNIWKCGPEVDFEIAHTSILESLILELFEGFDIKTVLQVQVKINTSHFVWYAKTLPWSPNFRAFFSKSTFYWSVMTTMKWSYLKNAITDVALILSWKTNSHRKYQKVSFELLTPDWPISMWSLIPYLARLSKSAVDDKDLTVSSNQGNTWLFVHPTLVIMAEECWTHKVKTLQVKTCTQLG